jgi:hypothetical protein
VFTREIPRGRTGFDISISAIFKEARGSLRGTLFKAPGFLGFDMAVTKGVSCEQAKLRIS